MDITPLIPKGRNIINSYSDDKFIISQKEFFNSVLLQPEVVLENNLNYNDLEDEEKILQLLSSSNIADSEILLFGTGKNHKIIKSSLKNKIKEKFPNISINEMTTAAACRTFNILTLEDRKVVAILISNKF